jgi:nicotinamidase-related amidase
VDKRALLTRTAALIEAVRKAGIKVIYIVVGFRPGYPEASPHNKSFSASAIPAASSKGQLERRCILPSRRSLGMSSSPSIE